ncbi:MAG: TetR/AcrR family transcriptional regulator [Rhodospirillales bacterium]|nr:TetR/AcrR family transcriptional regulator [Rhodospirillales bacterium]
MIAQLDTRDRILDAAQFLLETRGYNAFSYQDIANQLGIKKASIHYHFPTKADLGAALAARHTERARELLQGLDASDVSAKKKIEAFIEPFQTIADGCDRVCAGGMIAAEFPTLDPGTQANMRSFFHLMHQWLATVLDDGRADGSFSFKGPANVKADVFIAALEGMILLARVRQDPRFLKPLIKDLVDSLNA